MLKKIALTSIAVLGTIGSAGYYYHHKIMKNLENFDKNNDDYILGKIPFTTTYDFRDNQSFYKSGYEYFFEKIPQYLLDNFYTEKLIKIILEKNNNKHAEFNVERMPTKIRKMMGTYIIENKNKFKDVDLRQYTGFILTGKEYKQIVGNDKKFVVVDGNYHYTESNLNNFDPVFMLTLYDKDTIKNQNLSAAFNGEIYDGSISKSYIREVKIPDDSLIYVNKINWILINKVHLEKEIGCIKTKLHVYDQMMAVMDVGGASFSTEIEFYEKI